MRLFLILTMGFVLQACQSASTGPGFAPGIVSHSKNSFFIESSQFEKTISKDKKDSSWKVMEIRVTHLPYTGPLAQLSAQERWTRLFEKSLNMINDECGGPVSHLPDIKGDEANYFKFGTSPQYPKWLRARYTCSK